MMIDFAPEKLHLGLPLVEKIDPKRYGQLCDKVLAKLPVTDDKNLFNAEEKEKLMAAFDLKNQREINSVLSFTAELWNQIAFHLIKPSKLAAELKAIGLTEEQIPYCVDLWSAKSSKVLERLKDYSSTASQLKDVNWTVNVDVAGSYRQKVNEPIAHFNLDIQQGDEMKQIGFGADQNELYDLFQKLESIQGQIDSLMG